MENRPQTNTLGAACDLPAQANTPQQSANTLTDANRFSDSPPDTDPANQESPPVQRAKQAARETVQRTKESLKGAATSAVEEIQERGTSWIDRRRSRMADELAQFSDALGCATSSLSDRDALGIGEYADLAARGLQRTEQYLRSAELGTIRRDVERFARRRPEVFFGGLFLIGLAASRFLKAGVIASDSDAGDAPQYAGAAPQYTGFAEYPSSNWSET